MCIMDMVMLCFGKYGLYFEVVDFENLDVKLCIVNVLEDFVFDELIVEKV